MVGLCVRKLRSNEKFFLEVQQSNVKKGPLVSSSHFNFSYPVFFLKFGATQVGCIRELSNTHEPHSGRSFLHSV